MAVEFTVKLDNRPGTLADLTEALGMAGINITAIHGIPGLTCGGIQFITNNTDATVNALGGMGMEYTTCQVLLVTIPDVPGSLARLARSLAQAEININALYLTLSGQIVLDVDNLTKAQKVILDMGIVM